MTAAWLDAAASAALLGVRRPTLYAYVSRGYVRSQPASDGSRARRYAREDLERLRRRADERRDPGKAAAQALQWGLPILESSIALIDGQALYYRGHDAVALARTRSVEETASLVWTGRFDTKLADTNATAPARIVGSDLAFVARAQSSLVAAGTDDPLAFDRRPDAVAATGWRILMLLAAAAAGRGSLAPTPDRLLAEAWRVPSRAVSVLRAAIILCADHELNVSSFTARCVASAGSSPYAVVLAGLAALEGTRHGGMAARVEAMLASIRRLPPRRALADRLRRGEAIDGFGHPLYRDGDPRARALLALLKEQYPESRELAFVLDVAEAAAAIVRDRPTIDFALAAVARILRLPAGAPLAVFAIGRTIGWIGHAIEQYSTGQLIRPRARYVGPMPTMPARPSRL
jgi:citrate synthase